MTTYAPPRRDVMIVGAGIGGLSTGLALARAGHAVRVFEQAPALGEIGAGLTLSPNAVHALTALGVGKALDTIASEPRELVNLHYQTGAEIVRRPMGEQYRAQYGAPYYHAHRADLHALLADALERVAPGAIVTGKRAIGVASSATAAEVRFADGSQASAEMLVGADGVRSVVHQGLYGASEARFTGRVAWRAVLPAEAFADIEMPASMGSILGPDRTFAWYPLRKGTQLNLVFMSRWDQWADEDWRALASRDDVREAFRDWLPLVHRLIDRLPDEAILRWGLFDRPPYEAWHRDTVTFVGDAIHPMLPYMGQGAAMAIEDAVVLGRALEADGVLERALACYARTRKPRADAVQEASSARANFWEKSDLAKLTENRKLFDAALDIYPYDPREVPLETA